MYKISLKSIAISDEANESEQSNEPRQINATCYFVTPTFRKRKIMTAANAGIKLIVDEEVANAICGRIMEAVCGGAAEVRKLCDNFSGQLSDTSSMRKTMHIIGYTDYNFGRLDYQRLREKQVADGSD